MWAKKLLNIEWISIQFISVKFLQCNLTLLWSNWFQSKFIFMSENCVRWGVVCMCLLTTRALIGEKLFEKHFLQFSFSKHRVRVLKWKNESNLLLCEINCMLKISIAKLKTIEKKYLNFLTHLHCNEWNICITIEFIEALKNIGSRKKGF